MPTNEAPSYSSSRIQRAARINSIEAVRLQQRLHCLEQAKLHHCRMKNQDIRLISVSIDYIQSCSGHSPEAWRPEIGTSIAEEGQQTEEEEQGPCFMYGERIRSRKQRRFQRPVSAAVDRPAGAEDSMVDEDDTLVSRPKSSPVKPQRSSTSMSFFKTCYDSETETNEPSSRPSTAATNYKDNIVSGGGFGGRLTPHQDWEDETFEITKKIFKAQALVNYGKPTPHLAKRSVRGLTRVTKITPEATPLSSGTNRGSNSAGSGRRASAHQAALMLDQDFPPKKPQEMTNAAGKRATLGEILSQRQPTLSAGAWRSHLNQTSAAPLSISGHRQLVMETKKQLNETRLQKLNDRVNEFISKGRSSLQRSASSLR